MTHTPGPWDTEVFYRQDGTGIAVTDKQKKNVIAWVYASSPNVFGEMRPSSLPTAKNAKLMAAAPELLGCLEQIRDAVDSDVLICTEKNFAEFCSLMTTLTQTIYKARGKL